MKPFLAEPSFFLALLGASFLVALLTQLRIRSGLVRATLRSLLLTLACLPLCLLLAGFRFEERVEQESLLALLDVSQSVDARAAEDMLSQLRALEKKGFRFRLLPFAERQGEFTVSLSEIRDYARFRDAQGRLGTSKTNFVSLADGLLSQEQGKVLLLSDGYESDGTLAELRSAARLFPVLPADRFLFPSEFQVKSIFSPLRVTAGSSAELKVLVENSSDQAQSATLRIFQNETLLKEQSVELDPNSEQVIKTDSDALQRGISELRAELIPKNRNFAESQARSFLSTEKREKLLLVSGGAQDERLLKQIFEDQDFELESKRLGASRLDLKLDDVSTVLFNNVPIDGFVRGTDKKIEDFVKKGGGFIMLGGPQSFGLGGYIGTEIEEILPVRLLKPRTEKKRLNVALQLVLDKSRSMAFDQKIDFAKEAAREVIRNLKQEDYIGVIGFDSQPFVVVRIGRLSDIREKAMSRVMRLFPAKSTNLFPAMQEALRGLRRVQAGRKHMIVLTDGKLPDAGPSYLELVKAVRGEGISLSTVMLGASADPFFLREMSRVGGGSFYQTNDPRSLPRIFLKDVEVNTGEKSLKEDKEFTVRAGPDGVLSTDIERYPSLLGFVETLPKDKADLELLTISQTKARPLLASWDQGQGKVAAFTSDANGRWSRRWVNWKGFYSFWRDLVDSVRPDTQASGPVEFDFRTSVQGDSLELELVVFEDLDFSQLNTELQAPDGTWRSLSFETLAKGRFKASVPLSEAGVFSFRGSLGERELTELKFFVSGALLGERRGQGFNLSFLEQLALESGGELRISADKLRGAESFQVKKIVPLQSLFLASLFLFCLFILFREFFSSNQRSVIS